MSKIKLTKGELKHQRDALSQFQRYLPTLQLKKQQLQLKIFEARREIDELRKKLNDREHGILRWVAVLADPAAGITDQEDKLIFDLKKYLTPEDIRTSQENIAGVFVPVLTGVGFPGFDYDLYTTPLWVDRAILELRKVVELEIEIHLVEKKVQLLQKELRTTTQRVNLFEKVKIPEARDNIRRIRIYLGDQQANAVGISKVAKKKIEQAALVQT